MTIIPMPSCFTMMSTFLDLVDGDSIVKRWVMVVTLAVSGEGRGSVVAVMTVGRVDHDHENEEEEEEGYEVNLLLCGQAVPNVFDGRMDLGGGMFLKGIPTSVQVGFLTLLESLNFCKVGQHLKRPRWPVWVVGSESHYTVLFALDPSVQDENELEERESKVRKAFDAHDQSGGGGFVGVELFHQVLREIKINLPPEKIETLASAGFVVWSEFWQALLELDGDSGGFKDSSGMDGKKHFCLYHFNGIAKAVVGGERPVQRPRLCKLRVSVPPKWSQDEFMGEVSRHAPLVDCVRTRWARAGCGWVGDDPSIV